MSLLFKNVSRTDQEDTIVCYQVTIINQLRAVKRVGCNVRHTNFNMLGKIMTCIALALVGRAQAIRVNCGDGKK